MLLAPKWVVLVYSYPWGRPVPDLEIRNFKLSCLNNWFLARTCLSKLFSLRPLLLLDTSVSREVLGAPEKCFWIHWLFPTSLLPLP